MRRFLSITTIAALISSSASPLLASACHHAGPPLACHRAQQHKAHCSGMAMEGHHHDDAAPESDLATVQGSQSSGTCPMDCCIPGHPKNATTMASVPELPPLAVIELVSLIVPVVFTCHGFSSHTDRGPPAA